MLYPILAVIIGLILLVKSADLFVDGSASTARHFGMSPLLIGMIIVGFGTSAPEMVVSALASIQGNPGIALGNAYGSNIANIALILGITALISPIIVKSGILKKELPILIFVTIISALLILDNHISRIDAMILITIFIGLMGWTIVQSSRNKSDIIVEEFENGIAEAPLKKSIIKLIIGLIVLILSSRILVWGAVEIAQHFGVSDLIIGLTIVAIGTSLPELASSVIAAKKGEHDIALGNVIGSNLFNTLAVVGIAGSIHPLEIDSLVLKRDMSIMGLLTVLLFVICYGFRGSQGKITRIEGSFLLIIYAGYTLFLLKTAM